MEGRPASLSACPSIPGGRQPPGVPVPEARSAANEADEVTLARIVPDEGVGLTERFAL